ncbi:MAG: glycosyl transferase family 1, partial [Haliea sp.]
MRVLFVSDYPHLPDIRGGLQTTTHDLCLAIGMAGAEAAVLCG